MRRLRLLGPACVDRFPKAREYAAECAGDERRTGAVPRFRSRRTMALLGYLVVERRSIARDFLATLFWPDEATSKGRSNLRRELHNLAQILPGCWELDRQAVAFAPSVHVTIDLYSLLQLEAEESWLEAAELLGGEFLEGLYLDDNIEYENWLLGERERWRDLAETVLTRVIEGQTRRGRYSDALAHSRRLLQLAPWNEGAHRQAMRLLAWTGQRGAALRQFESCEQALWEELGVEPNAETTTLYQGIRAGALDLPPQLPTFLTEEVARHEVDQPLFVTRERELAQLDSFLKSTLSGQGQVVFVTGGPGSGKTALLDAFAQQAMEEHPELLVASGNCNAYSDVGDPYLPFRDVMAMLTGDVEAQWDAGAISRDHAQRLWAAFPLVAQALLDHGLHLLDVLVPGAALLSRAALAGPASEPWLSRLRAQVSSQRMDPNGVEQDYLFQQVTHVLRFVAEDHPLLLVLDDIQWSDVASISLLFHLGRRLAGADSRVLIACAYRPEEVVVDRAGRRHSLARVLSEFKRIFGDVWLDLGQSSKAEGRRFINALLGAGPYRLAGGFRDALFQRTEGHPLFTVELLQAMRERGNLCEDEEGYWIEGAALDWEALPARVEAVIAERVERLEPELQEMLAVASVEGEVFTAQVVTQVQEVAERLGLAWLSQELEKRHRLVREQDEVQTDQRRLSRYRFQHVLFRNYVYNRLSTGERRLLHRSVASSLEELYDGRLAEMAVQLAHHHQIAGNYDLTLRFLTLAAERAARLYANDEAIAHYTRAIEVTEQISPDTGSLARLHRGRGLSRERSGDFDGARADHRTILRIARCAGDDRMEWRALLDLGKLWASRDYNRARDCFERALELSRRMHDATALARSLNWMGNWHANAEESLTAVGYHQEALEIVDELGDERDLAHTLDLLGLAYLLGGDLTASVRTYDRAIAICRELDDRPRLVTGLIARAVTVSELAMLASVPAIAPPNARGDFEKALRIAREIDSTTDEAWASWALGLLHTVRGRFGQAIEVVQSGLQIASETGHREFQVAGRCALGMLYCEVLAPEHAQPQLEQALVMAGELRSQTWIHRVAGALAGSRLLLDDLAGALACLDTVLSGRTAMDTMGKRYCWARRAELALAQGDPALGLEIADRLIATAPGMVPGSVITFLWKLKGEASMALGHREEAQVLLQDAINHAKATGEWFLLWRIQASLGRLYRAIDRQSAAEQEESTARIHVEDLAITIPDRHLRSIFLQRAREAIGQCTSGYSHQ